MIPIGRLRGVAQLEGLRTLIRRMQARLVKQAIIARDRILKSSPPLAIATPANASRRDATVSRMNFLLFGGCSEAIGIYLCGLT
jgi:hypothetical protein